jgi:hypothetical protein
MLTLEAGGHSGSKYPYVSWRLLGPLIMLYGLVLLLGDNEQLRQCSRKLHLEKALDFLVDHWGFPAYRRQVSAALLVLAGSVLTLSLIVTALRSIHAP